jgi:hypothetical protein
MDYFKLSRNYWDWAFENPDLVSTSTSALYFFILEHCNRLGWKEKFGLPTEMAMSAIGIKNYRTYYKSFEFLVQYKFIKVITKSKNQYSANVIAIVENTKATTKAYTKATHLHLQKQSLSSVDIDIPNTLIPNTKTFIPPALFEVVEYFVSNGYTPESAEKAFKYYEVAQWKDSKGNQVKNWKQKMQGVWFKSENLKPQSKMVW